MTTNQRRAHALAARLSAGEVEADALPEGDWHLLLLAAGVSDAHATPQRLARRVLERAAARAGYFIRATAPEPAGA